MFFKNLQTEKTIANIQNQLSPADDFVKKEFNAKTKKISLLYYKSLVDEEKIQDYLLKPFIECEQSKEFLEYLQSHPKVKKIEQEEDALNEITTGNILIYIDHLLFVLDLKKEYTNMVSDTTIELTVQGPHSSFSENVETNLNLVRQRYPQPSLKVENTVVGTLSRTKVALLYDEKIVNPEVLKDVHTFLAQIQIDMFQSGEQLNDLINKKNRSLLPIIMTSERPDRVAHNIAQGKVVLFISGSSFAVIIPTVFYDFMSSMSEVYHPYWVGRFLLTLRYIGLLFAITLPAVYVAVTSYNPEVFRVQLALSIAGSRASVPYPSFLEVLFMLLMMELLTEASIRLPKSIGPTATTVGGLILGQAATEAGLVSNIMIILVSAVAISNFVIPISTMEFAIRTFKFFLLGLATLYGLIGVVVGMFFLIAFIVRQDSFGQPFLKLFLSNASKSKKILKT